MPWQIWSPEDFPKRGEQGYLVDYCTAYGIQVVLHREQWTELDEAGFYTKSYSNSWVDKIADEKEVTISAKDLAVRICRDRGGEFNGTHYPVGLMYCFGEKTGEKELRELEAEGRRRNLVYRKKVVESFETQFRVKSQGGPGRWTPSPYELECYEMLKIMPPEVVNRPAPAPVQEPKIIQPDAAMIAQLVAAEVDKRMAELTAPQR